MPLTRLEPLEIVAGVVLGVGPRVEAAAGPPLSPLDVLERAVLSPLRRPPCLVSFSGGCDSSAVLAVAAHVARREGLQPPVPATIRPEIGSRADERRWQEHVIRRLGLDDWIRIPVSDELDAVGPVARRVLLRHGLIWPFNTHFHVPILEEAAGGSVLTGIGGDEALGDTGSARVEALLRGRVRPVRRDVLRLAFAVAPSPLRRTVHRRRFPAGFGWLTADARRELAARWAVQAAAEPVRFAAKSRWWHRLRYVRTGLDSLAAVALDYGVELTHPLAAPAFSEALAHSELAGLAGRGDRMEALFGGLLPNEVCRRSDKAVFDDVFFGRPARELVAGLAGVGLDGHLVDAEGLKSEWNARSPDPHTLSLLQALWLGRTLASADGGEDDLDGLLERVQAPRSEQLEAR